MELGVKFVPVRKAGKLPGTTKTAALTKEYGQDIVEMMEGVVSKHDRVVIMDDVLATGGTALAAGELVRGFEGEVVAYGFMVELDGLSGKDRLNKAYPQALCYSLFHFPA
jgi:adenine phosphoribosyltransferase